MELEKASKKISYSELEEAYKKLYADASLMNEELNNRSRVFALERLNFLFKILEYRNSFPSGTVTKAVNMIESILFGEEEADEAQ